MQHATLNCKGGGVQVNLKPKTSTLNSKPSTRIQGTGFIKNLFAEAHYEVTPQPLILDSKPETLKPQP